MEKQFSRTEVAGVSLPRFIIGSNWMLGWSHKTPSMDKQIKERFANKEAFFPIFEEFMKYGIDAVMGLPSQAEILGDAVKYAEDKLGKAITLIDTPIIDVNDNADSRRDAEAAIKKSAESGSKFCLIHHSSCEQLVNRSKWTIDRIDDYTKMIRDAGMIPGLTAHMPEIVSFSDLNEYDVETYVQIFNSVGFLMQVEVEHIGRLINEAKKPVMTIKSMAAGRITPYVGLNFVWNTIRDCDMVTVGVTSAHEAAEDVEISFAALERRYPNLEKRSSPNKNQAAFGK